MTRPWVRISTLLTVLMLLSNTAAAQDICGTWTGEIGPGVAGLAITVTFDCDGPDVTASLDIPAQGVEGYALSNIVIAETAIAFRMPGVPGNPAYFGTISTDRIDGVYTQGASEVTFYLERQTGEEAASSSRQRPQEPQPPYPYEAEEITVETGDVTLAGTLTYPSAGHQPGPAVLLLPGSGMHDRDQSIAGHQLFHVLADHLTQAGVAVLRLDDRGVGESAGNKNDTSYEQLAEDASTALEALAEHPAVDPNRLGLIGHSQGGTIALITKELSDHVSFIVMLTSPATPGVEVLEYQGRTLLPAQLLAQSPNVTNGVIQAELSRQSATLHELKQAFLEEDLAEAQQLIRTRIEQQIEAGMLGSQQRSQTEAEQLIQAQVQALTSAQFRSLLLFDPQPYVADLQVPLLAIYGSLDLQVDATANTIALEQHLPERQHESTVIITLDNLNHLLQPAETGLPDEYALIETTIDNTALELITNWIFAEATEH